MSSEKLSSEVALQLITETINAVIVENGYEPVQLLPETNILHDTPLDSMGLAIVVLQLEDATGLDPFADGFILFQTVAELAALYES